MSITFGHDPQARYVCVCSHLLPGGRMISRQSSYPTSTITYLSYNGPLYMHHLDFIGS